MHADEEYEEGEEAPRESGNGDEIEALKAENAALRDRALRALAEVENVRKRAERERDETRQYALADFARALLQVSDNFARALAAIPPERLAGADDTLKAVVSGVEAIQRQLQAVLESKGIKLIPAEGQRFDPNLHHAVAEVPGEGKPAGTVVNVVQAGYTIGDRLLRPAMVTIARAEPGAAESKRGNGFGSTVDTSA